MAAPDRSASATVLDRLVEHLRARDAALDGQTRAAAILWTDPRAEWQPAIGLVQARVEELLVLGAYKPEARTGPAIWIRCLVDGALAEPGRPDGRAPIVYLPGVARQDLRAGEECRAALKPLVELMYRGAMWLQPNGNDWGVATFLTSPRGLGLDIARDRATADALLRALPEVALTPVAQLAGKHLQADDFDRMLAADVVRDLLRWMGDPEGTRARLGANGWAAFRGRCREEIGFDPDTEADVIAGERLGAGQGAWTTVWDRFAEAPRSYGELARLLRRSRPVGDLPFDRERWPDLNDQDEDAVRASLGALTARGHREACEAVARLEQEHGVRRGWVWGRMGLSPMAQVMEPLSRLAAAARTALGGTTPDDVASAYLVRGWQGDAAAWEAIAAAPTADERLVADAVRHLLLPWLDDSARAFQAAVARAPLPGRGMEALVEAGEDCCVLFADGLRYDLGQRLAERLEGRGCRTIVRCRWSALPTVTATAKPAVTPVADAVAGRTLGEDFAPTIEHTGQPAGAQALRAAMQERGYQILGQATLDVPLTHPARGWDEAGEIDALGHKIGSRLARQIDEEIERLAVRVLGLLDAGWSAVRVVTDHGWLLLPGGLPKVDLPKHLTASRWSRCAVIAGGATPEVTRAPWHWNPSEWFATAPGITCFNKSDEYAHGGLSIQECLTPDLLIERAGEGGTGAAITSITWRGLRCFVVARVRGGPVVADLRLGRASGASAAAAPKRVEADGSVSLVLAGDEHEAAPLILVLVDEAGHILAYAPTRAGVDS
ncbi:MAG TPA: BREX-1 system phosphatase PglZ type B [Candidatus Binatia bacterium]|nr:BREX-1 system phosphatase PglZ type B [Candidatus Binatia bacterium]